MSGVTSVHGRMLRVFAPLGFFAALHTPLEGEARPECTLEREGRSAPSSEVSVLARDGNRVLLEGSRWVSGTVLEFDSGLTVRISQVGPDDAWAFILEGTAGAGDCPRVRSMVVEIMPLHVAGEMSPGLLDLLRTLADDLPLVLTDPARGPRPDLTVYEGPRGVEILARGGTLRHSFPTGPDVHDRVGAVVLRELALRQLAALDNPLAPFSVQLSIEGEVTEPLPGGPSVRIPIGTDLRVHVRAGESGYLTLLNLGADGSSDLLAPTDADPLFLQGGTVVEVPSEGSGLVYRVGFPTGVGLIRALVTPAPLEFYPGREGFRIEDARGLFALLEAEFGVALDQNRIRIDHGSVAGWASALAYYEVFDPY